MVQFSQFCEFRPEKNQTFMVNGHYTKQKEHSAIQVWDIKKIHKNYDAIGISTLLWHRENVYFMCIKHLWSLYPPLHAPPHLTYITTNITNYEVMDTNATFWHRAQVYFTGTKPLLSSLITVPNMNKITTHFLSAILG